MFYLVVAAFMVGFLYDVFWSRCVAAVAKHKPISAANYSVCIYLCTLISTLLIVDKAWMPVVAFIVGSWLGTFITVRRKQ